MPATNPWMKRDLVLAACATDNDLDRELEQDLVRREFRASPQDTERCEICGTDAHFRPSVGTYQCPNRHVLSFAGDWR